MQTPFSGKEFRTSEDLKGQSYFSPEIEGKQCGIRKGRDHARPWSPYKQFEY